MLDAGILGFDKALYKTVLVYGFALDEKGREMHKSPRNYVGIDEAIKKVSRDPLRFWISQNTTWEDLRFRGNLLNKYQGSRNSLEHLCIRINIY